MDTDQATGLALIIFGAIGYLWIECASKNISIQEGLGNMKEEYPLVFLWIMVTLAMWTWLYLLHPHGDSMEGWRSFHYAIVCATGIVILHSKKDVIVAKFGEEIEWALILLATAFMLMLSIGVWFNLGITRAALLAFALVFGGVSVYLFLKKEG